MRISDWSSDVCSSDLSPHWAVHVLSTRQEPLSGRFAARGADKFAGLELDAGIGALPLLPGCAARFQCRSAFQYDRGDHVIFVRSVERRVGTESVSTCISRWSPDH